MKVYFIKISLRGVSPMVWRRLRVPGQTSLAMLHESIRIINGWEDFHLHEFHIYGKDYGINYEGGLSYSDDAYTVKLDDFAFDAGDKFTYEYDFTEHCIHDIRIEAVQDVIVCSNAISCTGGSGMPGAKKYDVIDVEFDMIKKIVDKQGKLNWSDIRDFQEDIKRVKFNKKSINEALTSLIAD